MNTPFSHNPIHPLKKGDTIAILSTARKVNLPEIEFGVEWLESLGFKVVLGKTIGAAHHQFAGTDNFRATDLQAMLDDTSVDAIWCARGGYGTVRIIDKLDFTNFRKRPKWIIGYSDITVLHSHLNTLGIPSIHAAMAFDIYKSTALAQLSLQNALTGITNTIHFASVSENITGTATGEAIGGNLSILYSLCGSPSAIDTTGKILFLEDLDEYLYHIDRMLYNLDRNGLFQNLAGLVICGMTNMHDNQVPFGMAVSQMIVALTAKYNFPVAFQAPFGHQTDNRAIIFGKKITLTVNSLEVKIVQ